MTPTRVFELAQGRVVLGSTIAVDGVDFELARGEFLALLGANGSGKTTLVRTLLRLCPLSGGGLRVFGEPLREFREWARIGYVPQRASTALGGPASVMEVALSGRIARTSRFRRYRAADRSTTMDALEVVGLSDLAAVPVARLSGGQQQRVLIARALAGAPDVLVLDEPLSGVDVEHQERVARTLGGFHDGGGTVLLVAHGLGPTEDLITREVVMDAGTVAYDGPHLPHHVHTDHVHHTEPHAAPSPLDRAAGAT
ncbi:MAG TPA: ATP-binding cassette domain-containing protein [Actinomycetota bacterium]|nr:ATP-binding cassette domain-containing protein [Actinomycetota bacterium]